MFHLRKQSGIRLGYRTDDLLHDGIFVSMATLPGIESFHCSNDWRSEWIAGSPDKQMPDGTYD